MKYKLIVDTGKPYEVSFDNTELLFKELSNIENTQEIENYAYCDMIILKGNKDITEEIFNQYFKRNIEREVLI